MIHVIIVAAGSGNRFGGELPKQFQLLKNKPVLVYSLQKFAECLPHANIITVVSKNMIEYWKTLADNYKISNIRIIEGGQTRWESVKKGIDALGAIDNKDIILVHDGARPLVSSEIINRVIKEVEEGKDGAIPVIEITDSIRQITADGKSAVINRDILRAVQTPQCFRGVKLKEAYNLPYSNSFTDEAVVLETAGYKEISLIPGDVSNLKITRPFDLKLAESYIDEGSKRI